MAYSDLGFIAEHAAGISSVDNRKRRKRRQHLSGLKGAGSDQNHYTGVNLRGTADTGVVELEERLAIVPIP